MPGILAQLLPRASNFRPANYDELLTELNRFGIVSRQQFRRIMLKHRHEALQIDRSPLDAVNERAYRSELGDREFYERKRTSTWFTWEGLVRIVLELEFGDTYRQFAEARDGT